MPAASCLNPNAKKEGITTAKEKPRPKSQANLSSHNFETTPPSKRHAYAYVPTKLSLISSYVPAAAAYLYQVVSTAPSYKLK